MWLVVSNMAFIVHNIWDNPSQLIFFRGVETTNQRCFAKDYMLLYVLIVPMGNPREMGNLVWD